jgi:hypothetical protein
MKGTNRNVPHYVIFSVLLSLVCYLNIQHPRNFVLVMNYCIQLKKNSAALIINTNIERLAVGTTGFRSVGQMLKANHVT